MITCRLFKPDEFRATEDARRAAVDAWRAAHPEHDAGAPWPAELTALSNSHFPPGSMWFCPWYHDPADPEDVAKIDGMIQQMTGHEQLHPRHAEGYSWHLSIHYYRTWARVRPPIIIVGPGGQHWCPDQVSSNGTGWTVTGEAPKITATPSIWLAQGEGPPREYHGWLKDGVFSPPC